MYASLLSAGRGSAMGALSSTTLRNVESPFHRKVIHTLSAEEALGSINGVPTRATLAQKAVVTRVSPLAVDLCSSAIAGLTGFAARIGGAWARRVAEASTASAVASRAGANADGFPEA